MTKFLFETYSSLYSDPAELMEKMNHVIARTVKTGDYITAFYMIIEPTNRILDICNRNGAKLTIMFEVAEYWAFKQYDDHLTNKLGYSPSQEMEQQAIKAIIQGHDVQLHIHPQWQRPDRRGLLCNDFQFQVACGYLFCGCLCSSRFRDRRGHSCLL